MTLTGGFEMNFARIEKQIKRKTFFYEQLNRIALVHKEKELPKIICLYSQALQFGGKPIAYEVFFLKHNKGATMPNGAIIEPCEMMPCDEDWGRLGWTHKSLPSAKQKLAELFNLYTSQGWKLLVEEEPKKKLVRKVG